MRYNEDNRKVKMTDKEIDGKKFYEAKIQLLQQINSNLQDSVATLQVLLEEERSSKDAVDTEG